MELLIREALEPLELPIFLKVIPENAQDESFDEYIMYGVYNVRRIGYQDDTYTIKKHNITLNYWYRCSPSESKVDVISELLEEMGFIRGW